MRTPTRIVVLERDPQPLRSGEAEKWKATYLGETVVSRSRDPEHDTCRALLARGVTGRVQFVHKQTGTPGLAMDVKKGAGRAIDQSTRDGRPRARKYRPFRTAVSSPASVLPLQGDPAGGQR